MALRPSVEVEPWEWTETHEPWHLEAIDLGNRQVEVTVLGREYRIHGRFRQERLYVHGGIRVGWGPEAPRPLSPFRETIILQSFRIAKLVASNEAPSPQSVSQTA